MKFYAPPPEAKKRGIIMTEPQIAWQCLRFCKWLISQGYTERTEISTDEMTHKLRAWINRPGTEGSSSLGVDYNQLLHALRYKGWLRATAANTFSVNRDMVRHYDS